jgi:hypothetical protein
VDHTAHEVDVRRHAQPARLGIAHPGERADQDRRPQSLGHRVVQRPHLF